MFVYLSNLVKSVNFIDVINKLQHFYLGNTENKN